MTRTLAIPCSTCGRKFGGQETFDRHRYIAGDRYKCHVMTELVKRGMYQDRFGVWHRGVNPDQGALSLSVTPESDGDPPAKGNGSEWDLEAGKRLRDEGMEKVTTNASQSWKDEFALIVRDFREQHRDFTSEDVTARIGMPDAHPNAVGAITRAVAVRYGAVKVGRVKAQRKNQHATEIALWGWR